MLHTSIRRSKIQMLLAVLHLILVVHLCKYGLTCAWDCLVVSAFVMFQLNNLLRVPFNNGFIVMLLTFREAESLQCLCLHGVPILTLCAR
jgi:hypothetical protein